MKMKRAYKVWAIVSAVILVLVLAGLLGISGCGEDEGVYGTASTNTWLSDEASKDGESYAGAAMEEQAYAPGADSAAGLENSRQYATSDVPSLDSGSDQKIMKDAVIEIEVEKGKFQSIFSQAQLLAERYGGYVLSSNSYASGEEDTIKSGQVVIRVRAESFEKAKSDAYKLGTVKGQNESTQDVTEEYVDLQARVRNQQAYVDSIQALLAKAETIDEILQVRQTLSYAQQELEQLRGRLQYLEGHTSFSTLTMYIYEAGVEVVTPDEWGFVQALKDAAHNLVDAFSAVARGLGWLIPILIILGILIGIVYVTVRAATRRNREERKDQEQKTP